MLVKIVSPEDSKILDEILHLQRRINSLKNKLTFHEWVKLTDVDKNVTDCHTPCAKGVVVHTFGKLIKPSKTIRYFSSKQIVDKIPE